jgi:sugar lactone lactonase YvrE
MPIRTVIRRSRRSPFATLSLWRLVPWGSAICLDCDRSRANATGFSRDKAHLQVSDSAHLELISWLAAHRAEVWVTTLQGALDWAKALPNPDH